MNSYFVEIKMFLLKINIQLAYPLFSMVYYSGIQIDSQVAHNSGPPTAHQRYAIEMPHRWRAVGGLIMCASWVYIT